MLTTLAKFPTFRQAEPVIIIFNFQGEFTKRAYANQKLDLIKAEGINDLINSESD